MKKLNKILMSGPSITPLEKKYVNKMMNDGWDNYYYVEKFEREFTKWHGRKYGLMTPNCTQAIHLMLLTLKIDIGDEIILPDLTWTATAAPITYLKAKPVFVDVQKHNWCICPESVEKNITKKTKAILFVDLYGNFPQIEKLNKISRKYNIPLIEDAAEGIGSKYKNVRAGKFGLASVHSFHRTKTMTTGEGGFLLLDNKRLYNRAKFLRDHGRSNKKFFYPLEATPKYMPSNLQGALALAQLKRVDELINIKRNIFNFYKNKFSILDDVQMNLDNNEIYNGAWATSLVLGKSYKINKLKLIKEMSKYKIPLRPFFYPLSRTPAYKKYNKKINNKNLISNEISNKGITLPNHFNLSKEQLEYICKKLLLTLKKYKK